MKSSKGSHAVEENINIDELTNDDDGETHSQFEFRSGDSTRLSSPYWRKFNELLVDGEWKAVCKLCSKQLSGDTKHGTSHLRMHTEEYCPRRHGNSKDVSQMLLGVKRKANDQETEDKCTFNQDCSRKELD